MTPDEPKVGAGSASEAPPAAAPAADSPPLSDLQQAIVARARETIERREVTPYKSWVQRAIALGLSLILALIAFACLNFLVVTIQRLSAEYSASKEAEKAQEQSTVTEPDEEAGVILIQPDRTLERPAAPEPAPPAESGGRP